MRHRASFASVLLLIGGSGCSSSVDGTPSVHPPGSVTLKVGSGATIDGTPWTVQFDSVVSDSRCPIGVFCILAGEAVLALELASPLANPLPQDSPHFNLGTTPVIVEGFRFSQVEVLPLARQNVTIDPKSYEVTLTIEHQFPPD